MTDKNATSAILLVDNNGDDSFSRRLAENYPVVTASNGAEALAKIEQQETSDQIGVVVADLNLADMSGLGFLEKLKDRLPEALRILTNDAEDVDLLLAAINQGHIYQYMHRPFDETYAVDTVTSAMKVFQVHHQRAAEADALRNQLKAREAELSHAFELVEQASLTDALTGLRNRGFMQHHFETELALIQRQYHEHPEAETDLLFLLADIDQFTPVNDIYGHAAGDRMLEEFACRLQEVFRGSDILVRWGGDQFLVVARFARRDGGDAVAERMRGAIANTPFDLGKGVKLSKTCSIGFAAFPFFANAPDIIAWNRVVNFADQARLVAKRSKGNSWVGFEPRQDIEPLDAAKRILSDPGQASAAGVLSVSTSCGSPSMLAWN